MDEEKDDKGENSPVLSQEQNQKEENQNIPAASDRVDTKTESPSTLSEEENKED